MLRFDRPFEADLGAAAVRLGSHIAALAASEDGKEIKIGLRSGIVLGHFRQFEPDLVVLDFMQASALPNPAQGAVATRIGHHDGYTRLVLDFGAPVVHELAEDGQTRILTFDRKARIDAVSLAQELRALVDEFGPLQGNRPGLVFRLRPAMEADVFALDEDKIVIDFRAQDLDEVVAGSAIPAATASERPYAGEPVTPGSDRDATARPASSEASRARPPEPGLGSTLKNGAAEGPSGIDRAESIGHHSGASEPNSGPATTTATSEAPPLRSGLLDGTGPERGGQRDELEAPGEAAAPQFTSRRTHEGIELAFTWPGEVAAAVFRRASVLWLVFDAAPGPAWRSTPPALEREFARLVGPARMHEPAAGGATVLSFELRQPLAVQAAREGRTWRILLRPHAEPPAAVPSERLDDPVRLRLLGDGSAHVLRVEDPLVGDELVIWPMRTSATGQAQGRKFVQIELLPTAQGLVLREVADGVRIRASRRAIEIGARGGMHLSAPPPDEGQVAAGSTERVALTEDAADRWAHAPPSDAPPTHPGERTGSSGAGMPEGKDAPVTPSGATVPPAPVAAAAMVQHGESAGETTRLAARDRPPDDRAVRQPAPSTTGADLDPVPVGVDEDERIGRVSARPNQEPDIRADGSAVHGQAGPPLRLAEWGLSEDETVPVRRARLMRQIEHAEDPMRDSASLDLARFFLAQAMAAETLAVLDSIDTDNPSAAPRGLARRSLTGAAELLMGRLLKAEQALDAPALNSDPEVALWRAAIAAARNDWKAAATELGRSENTLMSYPPPLQLRLGLPAAMIALEAGDPDYAFEILERVSGVDLHLSDQAQLNFIRGLSHARMGEVDRATHIWRAVERDGDEETRLKAGYALTTTLFGAGRIGAEEALTDLLPVRPLWRGHAWEIGMLDGLATIQAAAGDFGGAIGTWREGLRLHPVAGARVGLESKVRDAFRAALSAEPSDPLAPIAALALYRSHPDLLPPGEEGLDLRRRLAERLAKLDLIEPARDLLQTLLEQLPPGPAAGRDGTMLAALQLREPDPAAALASLDAGDGQDLADDLAGERIGLRAAALDALGRTPEAIAFLEGRADPASLQLMNEILWRRQDWRRLAASLERSLRSLPMDDGTSLGTDEQAAVVKLAIARAQLDQKDELARIRHRFGPAIDGTPAEAAFLMATDPNERATAPSAILATAGRQMKSIQAYLSER